MAGKLTDPWSPAAHHGIGRGTLENLGKTNVFHMGAAGKTVVCSGSIWATSKILRLSENIQKPLVKHGFGQEYQVARRKTYRSSSRTAYRQTSPATCQILRIYMKTIGKTSKTNRGMCISDMQQDHPLCNKARVAKKKTSRDLVLLVLPRIALFMLYELR